MTIFLRRGFIRKKYDKYVCFALYVLRIIFTVVEQKSMNEICRGQFAANKEQQDANKMSGKDN